MKVKVTAKMRSDQEMKCPGPHCKQQNEATEPHPCPYKSEINDDDETLCTCCETCEQECAWDI